MAGSMWSREGSGVGGEKVVWIDVQDGDVVGDEFVLSRLNGICHSNVEISRWIDAKAHTMAWGNVNQTSANK